jgi:serine/threonine-protein kinase
MGIVVAATHLFLREQVALKFLRPELLAHPELVARFAFEARAAAKVKSEHVARVLDVGEVDGVPFMVLEHLEGRDLGSRIIDNGPLSLREAAEYVIQACEALAEAHAQGIVHRDVKPENLFLVERAGYRLVKLIDFGISKAPEPVPASERGRGRSAATADEFAVLERGEVMGSPSYMSPEQLTQSRLDARTDIWSLGAVLYELLTGTALFNPYRPLQEIVTSVLHAPIPSILDRRPDLPLAIAGVLARCLARDPELRFQSAAELAVALLPFAPRRARESAERAVSQVRSSGASEPKLALPPSEAPRARSSSDPIPRADDSDPMLWALPDRDVPSAALRAAPLPALAPTYPSPPPPASRPSSDAPTVRIERLPRMPAPLDSSPATSRSIAPYVPPAPPRARYAMAFAAAFGIVAALGFRFAFPQLGADATAGGGALDPIAQQEPPSVLLALDGLAEPATEPAAIELDASVRIRSVRSSFQSSRCENPYELRCP